MRDAAWTKVYIGVTYDEGNNVGMDAALVRRVLGINGGEAEVSPDGEEVVITVSTGAEAGAAHPAATAEAVRRRLMVDAAKGKGGIIGSKGCSILKLDLLRYTSDPAPAVYRLPSWRRRHFASGPSLPNEEARIVSEEEDLYFAEVFAHPKGNGAPSRDAPKEASAPAPGRSGPTTATRSFKKRQYKAADVAVSDPVSLTTPPSEISALRREVHPVTETSLRFTPAEVAHLVAKAKKEWVQVSARRTQLRTRRRSTALPTPQPGQTGRASAGIGDADAGSNTRSSQRSPVPPDSRDSRRCGSDAMSLRGGVRIVEDEPCAPLDGGSMGFGEGGSDGAASPPSATGLIRMVAMDNEIRSRNYAEELEQLYANADPVAEWKLLNRERQGAFTALSNAILFEKSRRVAALQTATPQVGDRASGNGVRTDTQATMYKQLSSYATTANRGHAEDSSTDRRLHRSACLISVPGMRSADVMLNSSLLRNAHPTARPFAAGWDSYSCTRYTQPAHQVSGVANYHKTLRH
eukprot:TRINITY_DN32285_c0_g1_i1.p1 TRINITY_DN32285_c0_g1~~TRINITY_DN32285_c0_g1_i1.p1  ORF type:complete len:600 (+),score=177.65 TRINITY_DN32285_c0_g1_i1:238-1800(+)